MIGDITNWEKVRNYKLNKPEKMIVKKLFEEWINPKNNSFYEDKTTNELQEFYNVFEAGWIVANIWFE